MLYVLTHNQLTDQQAEAALAKLPPVEDNTLVLLRNLQAQITALTERVETLEEA